MCALHFTKYPKPGVPKLVGIWAYLKKVPLYQLLKTSVNTKGGWAAIAGCLTLGAHCPISLPCQFSNSSKIDWDQWVGYGSMVWELLQAENSPYSSQAPSLSFTGLVCSNIRRKGKTVSLLYHFRLQVDYLLSRHPKSRHSGQDFYLKICCVNIRRSYAHSHVHCPIPSSPDTG